MAEEMATDKRVDPLESQPPPVRITNDGECIDARERIKAIAALLFGADMTDPANVLLRQEAYDTLDGIRAFKPQESEAAYTAAMEIHITLERSRRAALKGISLEEASEPSDLEGTLAPGQTMPIPGFGMVVHDPADAAAERGRQPTEDERTADVYRMDASACGRSLESTIAACEVFGGQQGATNDRVKKLLGLL